MENTEYIPEEAGVKNTVSFVDSQEMSSILGDKNIVRNRIYNIRHGATKTLKDVPPKEGLEKGEVKRIKDNIGGRLINYGVTGKQVLMNFSGNTARIRQTARAIASVLNIDKANQKSDVHELDSMARDYRDDVDKTARIWNVAGLSAKFASELIDVLRDTPAGTDVINVIHKTNFSAIESAYHRVQGENLELKIYDGGLQLNEIKEADLSTTLEPINYEHRKDLLHLGDANVDIVLDGLAKEELFQTCIAAYRNKDIKIYELQNIINYRFKKEPELKEPALYEKYLDSNIDSLRIFAFANYYRDNHKDNSKEKIITYLKKEANQFPLRVWINVFDIIKKDSEILEIYLNEFFSHAKNDNEYAKLKIEIFKSLDKLGEENMLLLNYYQNIYPLVKQIRGNSIDTRIAAGANIHPTHKFSNEQYNDIENLLKDNGEHKIKYIEADAGSGKSFLLSNINQLLKDRDFELDGKKYFPIFLSLSGELTVDGIKSKIDVIETDYKTKEHMKEYQKVLILDSIDESKLDEKKREELLKYLTTKISAYRIIISSRKGYIPMEDNGKIKQGDAIKIKDHLEEIELQGMQNIDEYVESYFQQYEDSANKIAQFNQFKSLSGSDAILSNPLMVTMVCNLIGDDISLAGVSNISDIYDKVIDMRLLVREQQKTKQSRTIDINEDDDPSNKEEQISAIIERRKDFLSEVAYLNSKGNEINKILLLSIKKNYPGIIIDNECLNLLFKKDSNQEYGFVHQSFKDYFLAKAIVNILRNNQISIKSALYRKIRKIFDVKVLSFIVNLLSRNDTNTNININIKSNLISSFILAEDISGIINLLRSLGEIGGEENIELIKGLKDHDESSIRSEIIEVLGKIGGEENIKFIKSFKNDNIHNVKAKIIEVLGEIGGEDNIEFIKSFKDSNVNSKIIETLGKIGGEDNIEFIKSFKGDRGYYVRESVIEALGEIGGEDNIEFIKSFKDDREYKVRKRLIEVLGEIGGEDNIEFIKSFKNDREYHVRESVVEVLGKLGGEDNIEFIKSFKDDNDNEIRCKLIKFFSGFGGEENIEFIKGFKNDRSYTVRSEIIKVLGKIGGEGNIEFIKSLKDDKDSTVRSEIIEALGKLGGEDNIEFIKSFKNDNFEDVRISLISALCENGCSGDAIEFLMMFALDHSIKVRVWLMHQLREYQVKGYNKDTINRFNKIDWINQFRYDKNKAVRMYIIETLGKIGGEDNIEFIKSFKDDDESRVKVRVIEILGEIGGEDNIEFIKSFKDDSNYLVRLRLLGQVGGLGGIANINFIKQFQNDPHERVRTKANEILSKYKN